MQYYEKEAGQYFGLDWGAHNFSQSRLVRTNFQLLLNAIRSGLVGRSNTRFLPLFKFEYADGHRMITLGGMVGTETETRRLRGSALQKLSFVRLDTQDEPYQIRVPHLTRKERLYLDSQMPCEDGWNPEDFELEEQYVQAYKEIYRYYPVYAELFL